MLLAYNNPFWEILYQTIPPNLVVLIIVADANVIAKNTRLLN